MTNKMTYKMALTTVIDTFGAQMDAEVREKLEALLARESRERTSGKAAEKKTAEAAAVQAQILEALGDANEGMTATEIMKTIDGDYSVQKISAHLKKLYEVGELDKVIEKRVARFYIKGMAPTAQDENEEA